MLSLRARAARLPGPSPSSSSSAPTTSLSGFARQVAPLALLARRPPPAALSPLPSARAPSSSFSAMWGPPMHTGAAHSRPSTRVFCTAAGSAPREGKELLVQHLLVGEKDVRLLVDLEKSIIAEGADLSDLAVEYSLCPSKENGGMLGWVRNTNTIKAEYMTGFVMFDISSKHTEMHLKLGNSRTDGSFSAAPSFAQHKHKDLVKQFAVQLSHPSDYSIRRFSLI